MERTLAMWCFLSIFQTPVFGIVSIGNGAHRQTYGFFDRDNSFFSHSALDADEHILVCFEQGPDLLSEFTLGELDILFAVPIVHEIEEAIVIDIQLQVNSATRLDARAHRVLTTCHSLLVTLGTFMLWVEGERSSYFRPVKI